MIPSLDSEKEKRIQQLRMKKCLSVEMDVIRGHLSLDEPIYVHAYNLM